MRADELHDQLHRAFDAVAAVVSGPDVAADVRRMLGQIARDCREWEENGRLYGSLAELNVALAIQGPRERVHAAREAQRHISVALRELHHVVGCDRADREVAGRLACA